MAYRLRVPVVTTKTWLETVVVAGKSEIIRQPGAWLALLFCFVAVMATLALTARDASQKRSVEAAAPESSDRIVTAANQEGKIVVFGPAGDLIRSALIEAFRNSFPRIVFEYVGGRAAEQAMRIKAERDGGVFSVDVFIGGRVTMRELGSMGALEPLEAALILPR